MKKLSLFFFLISITLNLWGQDFLSRGRTYYANGNYSDAIEQFEAQLAYYDSKNVSKNADEYIKVEKMLSRAKTCLPLSKKAKTAFNNAEKADSEDAYNAAIEAYDKLLRQNSSDRNAIAMKKKCTNAITSLEYERKAGEAWAQVDLGSLTAIDEFKAKYPYSKLVKVANQQITNISDNLAWRDATTKEDYEKYLIDFPTGQHNEDAQKYIEHWDEIVLWKGYLATNTETGYNEYLTKFPCGLFINEAKQGIANIKDDQSWAKAQSTNTLQGYRLYLIQHYSGRHKTEAQAKKDELEALQAKEKAALTAFQKSPSLNSLKSFETAYPNSEFKSDAYDAYASYLCDRININSCKKADFKEAMSYAQTTATKNKINAKENDWKQLKSSRSKAVVGKILGYVLVGGAAIAGIIIGVSGSPGSGN